ncbi:Wzz/FepE/Etk N-terminal domain-containing protein [Mangrovibacterium lignilyticum]|uniref:Wzz/FepE/Etk N-terminal domain-containing protein n=1 Tax=Mangrovibacterium lignilyticum TaxID=2668052 RepID=UPI0013D3037D|nr:Wzz/FepE/Etk N-terminal domain-containing protein [Mangrovibacterium lignilyticum]
MTTKDNTSTTTNTDDEIDLIALAKTLWDGRKTVIKFTLIGMALGLLFALLSPKEYTASTTMVPQTGGSIASKLGGLSSLASLAGVSMSSAGDKESLLPNIYPQIVQSIPFQLELMNSTFNCPKVDHPVSLYDYFVNYNKPGVLGNVKKYTLGLPGLLIGALKGKPEQGELLDTTLSASILNLTEDQDKIVKILQGQINLEINDKEGFLTISSRFSDPLLAAQVTRKTQTMLLDYVSRYKLDKANEQLKFIEARYAEKKAEFELIQQELAEFRDRNKYITTATASTQLEQLQTQYNLAYALYSDWAKQLEQAQVQVKEDTPILTIIEPVRVPSEKSKPNRPMILIIWVFLGGILGTGLVFGREFYGSVKKQWNTAG